MRCFSVENTVTGIDTDVIPQGVSLRDYAEMLRVNSGIRVVKTLGRKVLGFDRGLTRALARRLGVAGFPRFDVRRMDACRMTFGDAAFDVVHSHSVFEHIADPAAALQEVRRVLRPGGVAYLSVHLYTSHSGAHDPKIMAQGRPEPPLWPHLRPDHRSGVNPSTYLNEIRLEEWKRLFAETLPGVSFVSERQDELGPALATLRGSGELGGYTDDELLTLNFIGIYRK
jgi:SAM-dependent methyltransferase